MTIKKRKKTDRNQDVLDEWPEDCLAFSSLRPEDVSGVVSRKKKHGKRFHLKAENGAVFHAPRKASTLLLVSCAISSAIFRPLLRKKSVSQLFSRLVMMARGGKEKWTSDAANHWVKPTTEEINWGSQLLGLEEIRNRLAGREKSKVALFR